MEQGGAVKTRLHHELAFLLLAVVSGFFGTFLGLEIIGLPLDLVLGAVLTLVALRARLVPALLLGAASGCILMLYVIAWPGAVESFVEKQSTTMESVGLLCLAAVVAVVGVYVIGRQVLIRSRRPDTPNRPG